MNVRILIETRTGLSNIRRCIVLRMLYEHLTLHNNGVSTQEAKKDELLPLKEVFC